MLIHVAFNCVNVSPPLSRWEWSQLSSIPIPLIVTIRVYPQSSKVLGNWPALGIVLFDIGLLGIGQGCRVLTDATT